MPVNVLTYIYCNNTINDEKVIDLRASLQPVSLPVLLGASSRVSADAAGHRLPSYSRRTAPRYLSDRLRYIVAGDMPSYPVIDLDNNDAVFIERLKVL